MKQSLQLILLMLALFVPDIAYACDYEVDGIYYPP